MAEAQYSLINVSPSSFTLQNDQLWTGKMSISIIPLQITVSVTSNYGGTWKAWFEAFDANNNRLYRREWANVGTVMDFSNTDISNIATFTLGLYTTAGTASASDLSAVTMTVLPQHNWFADGGFPDNEYFVPRQTVLEAPEDQQPIWAFRQDDFVNLGYPYLILVPDLVRITFNPVKQREYICVYDMHSEKAAFLTNGLAILSPTEAKIHEIINGEYSLTLKHPMDALGKWRYIRESNIIKCCGQLFTIKRVEWEHSSEHAGSVLAYCEHIFYQLSDTWIYASDNKDCPSFAYCISAMNSIMNRYVTLDAPGSYRYDYQWSSDWEWGAANTWTLFVDGSGQTPVEKFIGSGGIIDQKGGELFRDNFYFSINQRMENAEDNAFDIRFGENMEGLRRTIDTSTLGLHLRLECDQIGWVAVSYTSDAFPFFQFPHNVARSVKITYDDDFMTNENLTYQDRIERMLSDMMSLFKSTATPIICYELSVKDLVNVYPELTNHYKFRVGNTGTVYDTLFAGQVTLKITETEIDGITGECTRVVIGSKNSFTRGVGYPLELNTAPSSRTYELPLHDSLGQLLFDSREKQMMRRGTI